MNVNNLPNDLLAHILSYLIPCDLYAFSKVEFTESTHVNDRTQYDKLLKVSLSNSLNQLLKTSNTKFKCHNPLESFVALTERLPEGSLCIR